jgi:hypothetical protein
MEQGLGRQWVFYYLFDLVIRFVLLNVIRGITVDTFSELRLAKLERLRDTREVCFICGVNKQVFDRDKISKGFKTHIRQEHNMWDYLYFIIYIWEQDKDDDDGLEQYVRKCLESSDISWVPAHVAMLLAAAEPRNEDETSDNFSKDIKKMEEAVLDHLSQAHEEIDQSVSILASLCTTECHTNLSTSRETSDVVDFEPVPDLVVHNSRPKTTPEPTRLLQTIPFQLKKSNTQSKISVMDPIRSTSTVTIELSDISGLTFPSRMLDGLTCSVKAPAGTFVVSSAHISEDSTVTMENASVTVAENYGVQSKAHQIVLIQVTRGSPSVYMGKVQFSMAELAAAPDQRLSKSFTAEVRNNRCRCVLTIQTTTRSSFGF